MCRHTHTCGAFVKRAETFGVTLFLTGAILISSQLAIDASTDDAEKSKREEKHSGAFSFTKCFPFWGGGMVSKVSANNHKFRKELFTPISNVASGGGGIFFADVKTL